MFESKTLKQLMLKLAKNLWWTWHPEIIQIWRDIDPQLWRECRHSPLLFINKLSESKLQELAQDISLRINIHRASSELNRYMKNLYLGLLTCQSSTGSPSSLLLCRNWNP